jgi:hypothetical protein
MNNKEFALLEKNYPLDYRNDLAKEILLNINSNESFSLIGMEDNCKVNLMRFIAFRKDVQESYIKGIADKYIFVMVDLNELMDFTTVSFYQLIGLSLLEALKSENQDYSVLKNIFTADSSLLFKSLKEDIQHITEQTGKSIVLIFNDFELATELNIELLSRNLVALRNSARYRVTYVFISTRPLLPSQFFYKKIIWMTPFTGNDAKGVIDRNLMRYEIKLTHTEKDTVLMLSGGHAGMIKFIIQTVSKYGKNSLIESAMCENGDIRFQCERLFTPLTEPEKAKLMSNVADDFLLNLGLQKKVAGKIKIFSPLLETVLQMDTNIIPPFCYDTELKEIYYFGKSVSRNLTSKEFLLLKMLIEDPLKVFTRDEIMAALWGEDIPTDWAFDKFLSRLREKLHLDTVNILQTVRGVGVVLYG